MKSPPSKYQMVQDNMQDSNSDEDDIDCINNPSNATTTNYDFSLLMRLNHSCCFHFPDI